MPEGTYNVIEVDGSSPNSLGEAIQSAVKTAAKSLSDLKIAELEVAKISVKIDETGQIGLYRARLRSVRF